jgi:hypothetical protein
MGQMDEGGGGPWKSVLQLPCHDGARVWSKQPKQLCVTMLHNRQLANRKSRC